MGVRSDQYAHRTGTSGYRRQDTQGNYYVDGNTVRIAAPSHAHAPERRQVVRTSRSQQEAVMSGHAGRIMPANQNAYAYTRPQKRQRLSYDQQKKNAARSRTAATTVTASINLSLTVLLVAAVAIVLYFGYDYLCLKASIDAHMDSIKTLETQLENLKNENDALEGSIDTSIDLNHIYSVAVNELGMVPADQSNIIQYDKTESEYVRQYEDIPSGQ